MALASGLAATVTITHMLKTGDGIVCMDDVYGGELPSCEMFLYAMRCSPFGGNAHKVTDSNKMVVGVKVRVSF